MGVIDALTLIFNTLTFLHNVHDNHMESTAGLCTRSGCPQWLQTG
jgi:hypothetical protein